MIGEQQGKRCHSIEPSEADLRAKAATRICRGSGRLATPKEKDGIAKAYGHYERHKQEQDTEAIHDLSGGTLSLSVAGQSAPDERTIPISAPISAVP